MRALRQWGGEGWGSSFKLTKPQAAVGPAAARHSPLQRVLELHVRGAEPRGIHVGNVVGDGPLPQRQRIERALGDTGGEGSEMSTIVRSVYREWKTQRIDEYFDDIARTAIGRVK